MTNWLFSMGPTHLSNPLRLPPTQACRRVRASAPLTLMLFSALTLSSPWHPALLLHKATTTTSLAKTICCKLPNLKLGEPFSPKYPVFIFSYLCRCIFQFPNLTISTLITGAMFSFIPHNAWYNNKRRHLIILFLYITNNCICIICVVSAQE